MRDAWISGLPRMRCIGLMLLMIACACAGIAQGAGQPPALATAREGYADAGSCLGCHSAQANAWKDSDHAWAMRDATPDNVLGRFDGTLFEDAGVKARFFRKGQDFFVNLEGEDGQPADVPIRYTFGHYPLQQYLVGFPRGRLQALTLAWDSRPREEGGQRWFSLYPGQRFAPDDPLHWTGRYQNWNAMCADCHSTRLLKGYDDRDDSFATTWQEKNVGCQGCHGPGQAHVDWARGKVSSEAPRAAGEGNGLQVDLRSMNNRQQVEQCAFCHSRRQTLGVGQLPGHPQLDQSLPAILSEDMYHADGQIKGEVYEFGSFTQSRMYAAGVACTDCHDAHTTKLRMQGNGLCLQCHNTQPPLDRFPALKARDYDSESHHRHLAGTAGAQCVNCHMPQTTYMQVDPRRDHSIRIPRPDAAPDTASPDACTRCHQDKSPAWAAEAIEGWFGPRPRPAGFAAAFQASRRGEGSALGPLVQVIDDKSNPAIVRATGVERLAALGPVAVPELSRAVRDESALVRAYAASGFIGMPAQERVKPLLPLIEDPALAVRDQAVRALADVPIERIPEARRDRFSAALADYERRLRSNADLPGGRFELAELLARQGNADVAMEEYRRALTLDPYFSPARINLVTLANSLGHPDQAERLLREGVDLGKMPTTDQGNLAYMLALLLVENGQEAEALVWMDKALAAIPGSSRIRYNDGLLLARLQRHDEAVKVLRDGLEISPDDPDLLYALIYLHTKQGERAEAQAYLGRMRRVAPGDPRLQALERYGR
ncbi:ammonia-forming cytochrome c nitrite reductase subunit c552 [Pseudomonas sp. PS02288]|uniref:ammonia-forming cytochrome c nitrite reductase subunit c552 n=1 Tax=Pseudomonas sp. PS02288 TaxID=2991443 RepID=UPI00249B18BD|nr:ammonia-forming cytochrome c nitrite reductase subunit c552 [Pseudomonas sp. PS02288]